MPTDTYRSLAVALFLLLAGCGTNVKTLLEEDGRLFWQADPIVMAAEDLDRDLVEPFNAAETAKIEACDALHSAAEESIEENERSRVAEFWSDVTMLFVRVFPVESVERCARAHERYSQELDVLRKLLEEEGVYVNGGAKLGQFGGAKREP